MVNGLSSLECAISGILQVNCNRGFFFLIKHSNRGIEIALQIYLTWLKMQCLGYHIKIIKIITNIYAIFKINAPEEGCKFHKLFTLHKAINCFNYFGVTGIHNTPKSTKITVIQMQKDGG